MSFKEFFPTNLSPNVPADKLTLFQERLADANTVIMASAYFKEGLELLRSNLASKNIISKEIPDKDIPSKHIKLGNIIGIGTKGGITYELLDQNGELIKSAVLRIDWDAAVPALEQPNPARIQPILKCVGGDFAATIVPRAKHAEFTNEEIIKTFAVIDASKQLPYLHDLEAAQFMKIEGISVPVLTDLSSVGLYPEKYKGQVETFLERKGTNVKSLQVIAPQEMVALHKAQQFVHDNAVAELKAAGVDIEPVPTKQQVDTLTRVDGRGQEVGAAR